MDDVGIDAPKNPISSIKNFSIINIDKIMDISEPFKFVRGLPTKPDIITKGSGWFYFTINDISFWVNSTLPEHNDLDDDESDTDSYTTVIHGGRYRVQRNKFNGEAINVFRFNGIAT